MIRDFLNTEPDFSNAGILITGGTGTFGKKLTQRLLSLKNPPKRLVIFSRDENKQYHMMKNFSPEAYPNIRYFIGDVRDLSRLEMAFNGIDIVIHAAALKHVTAAEYNPFETIMTNVHGAQNVVQAALRNNVGKVLALSTDKAASPINLYGASKLASDKIFMASNNMVGEKPCRFSVARYGNVIASRGSVIEYFQELIKDGATELPITDASMTRFWITINQAVDFVLSSLQIMEGGEIYIPKIPSMKTVDIATTLAPNLPHKIIGIRPGEKRHEVMVSNDDALRTRDLGDRYAIFSYHRTDLPGKELDDNFTYASDSNDEWLSSEDLLGMLKG